MADPLNFPIIADRRVPYEDPISFLEVDWTGSTLRMQVRLTKDTTGTPLLDATSPSGILIGYAGTATVAAHIAAGRVQAVGEDSIYDQINPATGVPYVDADSLALTNIGFNLVTSGFPFPEERGDDLNAWHDIIREPASGANEVIAAGPFIVRAGVTIP